MRSILVRIMPGTIKIEEIIIGTFGPLSIFELDVLFMMLLSY
jgi:hypothetical protein